MGNMCASKPQKVTSPPTVPSPPPPPPPPSLLDTLGQPFGKLVATEKAKDTVDDKVHELKGSITDKTKNMRHEALKIVEDEESKTDKEIDDVLTKIQEEEPGALKKAEVLYRKPVHEFLGLTDVTNQFADLKKQLNDKFDKGEQEIIDDLEEQKQIQKKNLDQQRPQIPVYDSLPETQKKQVFEQGEKKFQPQIKEQQQKMKKEIDQKINTDKYLEKFKEIDPSQRVGEISENAKEILGNARDMIIKKGIFC